MYLPKLSSTTECQSVSTNCDPVGTGTHGPMVGVVKQNGSAILHETGAASNSSIMAESLSDGGLDENIIGIVITIVMIVIVAGLWIGLAEWPRGKAREWRKKCEEKKEEEKGGQGPQLAVGTVREEETNAASAAETKMEEAQENVDKFNTAAQGRCDKCQRGLARLGTYDTLPLPEAEKRCECKLDTEEGSGVVVVDDDDDDRGPGSSMVLVKESPEPESEFGSASVPVLPLISPGSSSFGSLFIKR